MHGVEATDGSRIRIAAATDGTGAGRTSTGCIVFRHYRVKVTDCDSALAINFDYQQVFGLPKW